MSTLLFVCADTRQLYGKDFDEESSLASYQRLVRTTVARLFTLHGLHRNWFNTPTAIYIPSNAIQNCAQVVTMDKLMIDGIVCPLLNVTVLKLFWKEFIMDCLQKISAHLKSKNINKRTKTYVIIISSNLGLLGNYNIDKDNNKNVKEIVQKFSTLALELASAHDMTFHFICPIVSAPPGLSMTNVVDDVGCTQMLMEFSTQMGDKCIFQPIINTSIYYEEEIRLITSNISPIIHSTLVFPSLGGQYCSLMIDLIPGSAGSADLIHDGLSTPALHSICSKSKFNPLFIEGHAFTIIPTTRPSSLSSPLSARDKASENQNRVIFANLAKVLAKDSAILVLKVPYLENRCSQYWAVIPPMESDSTINRYQMILIKLVDKDSLLRCHDNDITEDIKENTNIDGNDDDDDEIMDYLQQSLKGMAFKEYNPRSSYSGYVNHMMTSTNITKLSDTNATATTPATSTTYPSTQTKLPARKQSSSSAPPGQLTLAKSSSSSLPIRPKTVHHDQVQVHRGIDIQKQHPNVGRGRESQRFIRGGGGRGRGRSLSTSSIAQVISTSTYDDDDELMDI